MIALIGFTGAGKTTLGSYMGKTYGLPCYDSDAEIVMQSGMSIATLFQSHGEKRFREIEEEVIGGIVAARRIGILVTGGGAILSPVTRTLLLQMCDVVHVYAALDTIILRLANDTARPLLASSDQRDAITTLYLAREGMYDFAHVTVHSQDIPRAGADVMAYSVRTGQRAM